MFPHGRDVLYVQLGTAGGVPRLHVERHQRHRDEFVVDSLVRLGTNDIVANSDWKKLLLDALSCKVIRKQLCGAQDCVAESCDVSCDVWLFCDTRFLDEAGTHLVRKVK